MYSSIHVFVSFYSLRACVIVFTYVLVYMALQAALALAVSHFIYGQKKTHRLNSSNDNYHCMYPIQTGLSVVNHSWEKGTVNCSVILYEFYL